MSRPDNHTNADQTTGTPEPMTRAEAVELLEQADDGLAMRLMDEFTDDHLLCGVIEVQKKPGGNWVRLGLWWCGWSVLAAVKYGDREAVAEFVHDTLVDTDDIDEAFRLP